VSAVYVPAAAMHPVAPVELGRAAAAVAKAADTSRAAPARIATERMRPQ